MSVKNRGWGIAEYKACRLLGMSQETLADLRKLNKIPRSCYRMTSKNARYETYSYDVKKTLPYIEEMRADGELRKSKKRRQIRQK